jgi:hypothetical protein
MENDTLMFAAIFLVAIVVICAGVVTVAFSRIGSTSKALKKRRPNYHAPTHRTFKDVM